MNRYRLVLPLLALAFALPAVGARAEGAYTKENWPLEQVKRPLTLAKGMTEIRGGVPINLSTDHVGKPFSLAPDVYYGASSKLTVGLTHSTGICLSGKSNGCAKTYDDASLDGVYLLGSTPGCQVGLHVGVEGDKLSSPAYLAGRAGIKARWTANKLAFVADPGISVAITERGDFMYDAEYQEITGGNEDALSVPLRLELQASPKLAVTLSTGINGQLSHFGDFYEIPAGVGGLFAVSNTFDLGGDFAFPNMAGKNSTTDLRSVELFVNFRL